MSDGRLLVAIDIDLGYRHDSLTVVEDPVFYSFC